MASNANERRGEERHVGGRGCGGGFNGLDTVAEEDPCRHSQHA